MQNQENCHNKNTAITSEIGIAKVGGSVSLRVLYKLGAARLVFAFGHSCLPCFLDSTFQMLTAEQISKIEAWQATQKAGHKVTATWMADQLGCNRKTVQKYLAGVPRPKQRRRCARDRETNKRNKIVIRLAKATTKKAGRTFPTYGSARHVANALTKLHHIKISPRQVSRILGAAGLHPYKRPQATTRDPDEVKTKVKFAKEVLATWRDKDYRSVVFSDETWLTTNEATSSIQYAASRRDVYPREKKSKWNTSALQCWAAVGVGWRSKLILFPATVPVNDDDDFRTSNATKAFRLNSAGYIRRCLAPHIKQMQARKGLIFQQDGAKPHKPALKYLKKKNIRVIVNYPSYCAEFNMVESCWKTFKEAVGAMCPMNEEELKRAAIKAWNDLPQRLIDRHVLGFRSALEKAVAKYRRKRV